MALSVTPLYGNISRHCQVLGIRKQKYSFILCLKLSVCVFFSTESHHKIFLDDKAHGEMTLNGRAVQSIKSFITVHLFGWFCCMLYKTIDFPFTSHTLCSLVTGVTQKAACFQQISAVSFLLGEGRIYFLPSCTQEFLKFYDRHT